MSYAVRKDGKGFRSVDSESDILDGEVFSSSVPEDLPQEYYEYVWDEEDQCWCRGVIATKAAIAKKKDDVLSAGYLFGGHVFQIREIDISNFQSIMLALLLGESSPHGGVWRDTENENIALTDTQMQQLAVGAVQYQASVLRAWGAHKDAIQAIVLSAESDFAADEAAEDYDINQGWPANAG